MGTGAYSQIVELSTSGVAKFKQKGVTPTNQVEVTYSGITIPDQHLPISLTSQDIEPILRLTLEELLTLVVHSGFTIVSRATGENLLQDVKLIPVEGRAQNLLEIGDGLNNLVTVCLGHAAEHGIVLSPVLIEMLLSNGTKLTPDHSALVNSGIVVDSGINHDCHTTPTDCVLLDEVSLGNICNLSPYNGSGINAVLAAKVSEDVSRHPVVCEISG